MFSKAALLIAVALVLFGYRMGKNSVGAQRQAQPAPQQAAQGGAPKKVASWLSVRVLLIIVIILLIIAIFSSLQQH